MILGSASLIVMFIGLFSDARLLGQARGREALSVLVSAPILAELIFFIPAFIFACCIAILRPRNSFRVCVFTSICGGGVASFWMFLVDRYFLHNSYNYSFLDSLLPVVISFFVGGLVNGVLAWWSLPKDLKR